MMVNGPAINQRSLNAVDAPAASGGYAQCVEIAGAERILFISGQVPVDTLGAIPATFEDQCRLVWRNIAAQLRAAEMTFGNLAKVTTFLSDRRFAEENGRVRREMLGQHEPALTVIIAAIYDEAWLLEIEAIAVA